MAMDSSRGTPYSEKTRNTLRSDALEKLEWPRLVAELAALATFPLVQKSILELIPNIEPARRESIFKLTREMMMLESKGSVLSLSPLAGRDFLDALRRQSVLAPSALYQVYELIRMMDDAAAFVKREKLKPPPLAFPELIFRLEGVVSLSSLKRELEQTVDAEGNVLSSASQALSNARSRVLAARNRIQSSLENLMRNQDVKDALQDSVWNVRDGRYVLPVRADRRGNISGVARGVSATGSTIYVEPDSLRHAQQEIEEAEIAVELEIHRILTRMSETCHTHLEELETGFEVLCEYDELVARAKFARITQGIEPTLHYDVHKPRFRIIGARHPLFAFEKKKVVPNDLILKHDFENAPVPQVWVLSGPNAGGKTVAMRTVGVTVLLARAALFVPALLCELYAFEEVFVELGDRQSRKDDLSSFSGHLVHMKNMVEFANPNALFLIDEGFVGTDPVIGMALARASYEVLADKGSTVIVTTHFSNLKTLADSDPRFLNASMEFETRELKPTYKLLGGIPGQSYALELAERLGLASDIVEKARNYQGDESHRLEKLLSELQEKRVQLDWEIEKQASDRKMLEEEVELLVAERKRFQQTQNQVLLDVEEKIQKRLNSFENQLSIRERQFERNKRRLLRELHASRDVNTEGNKTIPPDDEAENKTSDNTPGDKSRFSIPSPKHHSKKTEALSPPKKLSGFDSLRDLSFPQSKKREEVIPEHKRENTVDTQSKPLRTQESILSEAREKSKRLMQSFESDVAEFKKSSESLERDLTSLSQRAESAFQEAKSKNSSTDKTSRPAEFWKPGMQVRHKTFKEPGRVLNSVAKSGTVECQFGLIKAKILHSELMTPEEFANSKLRVK